MGAFEVGDIFRRYGADYQARQALSRQQHKVVRALVQCRTAALGGHVDACESCGVVRISYNSCRNRHCPKCQGLKQAAWLEQRRAELLPVPHFHVVFTLPPVLHEVVRHNESLLYGELMRQSWAALQTLCGKRRYLGAQAGMLAVLHTWGQNLHYHPHVHALVPAGGLRGRRWIAGSETFLVPVRALSRLLRGKYAACIEEAFRQKRLRLPRGRGANWLRDVLRQARQQEWVVYAKAPFAGAEHLLDYLGRYVQRVALSNDRILKVEAEQVHFRWRDYADESRQKVLALPVEEFMRRYLQHVLPAGFCKIRYYGILANRNRQRTVQLCRRALNRPTAKKPVEISWPERLYQLTGVDVHRCPHCEGRMQRVGGLPATGRPPPPAGHYPKARTTMGAKVA